MPKLKYEVTTKTDAKSKLEYKIYKLNIFRKLFPRLPTFEEFVQEFGEPITYIDYAISSGKKFITKGVKMDVEELNKSIQKNAYKEYKHYVRTWYTE
jgi:hypothetical protein